MIKIADADKEKNSELSDAGFEQKLPITNDIPPVEAGPSVWERTTKFVKQVPNWVWGVTGGATAIGLITFLVFIFFLNTHPVQVTVQSFTWERKIEIEAYEQRRRDGWDTPSDAYDIDTSWQVHHYESVYSHTSYYECGTKEYPRRCSTDHYRQEPVYRTYYDYTVDRWGFDYWLVAKATDKNPQWPTLPMTLSTAEVLGNEREGNDRTESYKVITDKGYVLSVKLPVYMQLNVGSTGTANVNRQNDVRSVNWDNLTDS